MEPQPQLQPIAPRPQLDFAEPSRRPLELKPGPRPLDLRPRPEPRPQLDVKMGPPTPQELARQRSSPLGNPLNVAKPVVSNPLGYAPGKGLVSFAAPLLERAFDPSTFGVPDTEFEGSGLGSLALPSFSPDALQSGPVTVGEVPPPFRGGQMAVSYVVTLSSSYTSPISGTTVTAAGSATVTGPITRLRLQDIGSKFYSKQPFNELYREILRYRHVVNHSGGTSFTVIGVSGDAINYSCGLENDAHAVNCQGESKPKGDVGAPQVYNIARANGQPDTGGDPAGGVPAQREQNPARKAIASPTLPARSSTPFRPAPVPRLAQPAMGGSAMPQIEPVKAPQLVPTVPVLPLEEPFKFPPPITVPPFPGDGPDNPESPTKRPPPVQFPPVSPGTTGRELQPPFKPPFIPIVVPPLRKGDCATTAELLREAGRIRDLIEEAVKQLLDDCKDLCDEAQLTQVFCDVIDGQPTTATRFETYTALAPALGFLSREIAEIKRLADPCPEPPPASVPHSLLASGIMVEGDNVSYVDISPEVRQVELIITGQLPNSLRLYDSTLAGEQQGKFGAITIAYPGVTGGNAPDAFHQWAWTRRTSFYVGPPIRPDRRIRIILKSGLSWVLYDTGLRS